VELRLRDIKTTLGMDILRGKSAEVVRVLSANLKKI
jgi:hypothetical protein